MSSNLPVVAVTCSCNKCCVVQLLTMNILTKLVAVILLSLPFIVVGGTLYKRASGAGWRESLFKSYVVLSNVPGERLSCHICISQAVKPQLFKSGEIRSSMYSSVQSSPIGRSFLNAHVNVAGQHCAFSFELLTSSPIEKQPLPMMLFGLFRIAFLTCSDCFAHHSGRN